MSDFPEGLLWKKSADRFSIGFHLQHLSGVIDRMLTYAKAEKLLEIQFQYLKNERKPSEEISVELLVKNFQEKVDEAICFLKNITENFLTEWPLTAIGLLSTPRSIASGT